MPNISEIRKRRPCEVCGQFPDEKERECSYCSESSNTNPQGMAYKTGLPILTPIHNYEASPSPSPRPSNLKLPVLTPIANLISSPRPQFEDNQLPLLKKIDLATQMLFPEYMPVLTPINNDGSEK